MCCSSSPVRQLRVQTRSLVTFLYVLQGTVQLAGRASPKNFSALQDLPEDIDNLALEEGIEINQVSHLKYLGTLISKTDGIGKDEIKNRIEQSKKIISCLNSIWWDKHIRKDTKTYIGKVLVESVLLYGSEIWTLNEYYRKRLQAVEMDYL
jgi:hypothetical protein